eukprot:1327938-Alexandrium_andersonii.AAC.1
MTAYQEQKIGRASPDPSCRGHAPPSFPCPPGALVQGFGRVRVWGLLSRWRWAGLVQGGGSSIEDTGDSGLSA